MTGRKQYNLIIIREQIHIKFLKIISERRNDLITMLVIRDTYFTVAASDKKVQFRHFLYGQLLYASIFSVPKIHLMYF